MARASEACFLGRLTPRKYGMRLTKPNGFILLEVLVAMSLILGAWLSSIHTYQGLALRFIGLEQKRVELRQVFDAHELQKWLGRAIVLTKG